MSGKKLSQRRIGFMIGSIALREKHEILTLTAGTFKKLFLESFAQKYISMGLNCFTSVCNSELSQFLHEDIIPLFSSSSVMVRRKAIASTYKIIKAHPEAISALSSYLGDALEDVSPAVQIASVTVMYELSRSNPKLFLVMVPKLFKLFQSDNNWLIIKLIKLMHEVIKVEPRMIKRLANTYQKLLMTTKAKSVEIDLIREIITNFQSQTELYNLAKEVKSMEYFNTKDNNLIYLGLSSVKCIMLSSEGDTSEFRAKIVQCLNKTDITVRRAALSCIQAVVTKDNVKSIVNDILVAIEELEHYTEPTEDKEEQKKEGSKTEETKQEKEPKKEVDDTMKDEEEEESMTDDTSKKRVIRNFSDADRSYRDLEIKTVLSILIDNEYEKVRADMQWCIEVMLKLGVYRSERVSKLVAETFRQLFINLDDTNQKTGIEQVVETLLESFTQKKDKTSINYSDEFLEVLCFTISQNSFAVGAHNSARILEYLRKHKDNFGESLSAIKSSLAELIFRLSLIELQNNLNRNREADVYLDRVKLYKELIIDTEPQILVSDMRYAVYHNILTAIAKNMQKKLSDSGNLSQLMEQISDLESLFSEEIIIGGPKLQEEIVAPACLDEEFEINEDELHFGSHKAHKENGHSEPAEVQQDPPAAAKTPDSKLNGGKEEEKCNEVTDES